MSYQRAMIVDDSKLARVSLKKKLEQRGMETAVSELFDEFNVWGLSCMGEQSNSLNMNNSFNGLAFALPP